MKKVLLLLLSLITIVGCSFEKASPEELERRNAKRQDETAIVLAQWALEEAGIKDYGKYTGNWNVARQERDDTILWIVTAKDSKYKRIKYIGAWSGDTEYLDYEHLYLLVHGNELYDRRFN